MSNANVSTLRTQAIGAAKDLLQQFLGGLKGQAPTDKEIAGLTWATQVMTAAPLLHLMGKDTPDLAEKVAQAKALMEDYASAHEVSAGTAMENFIAAVEAKLGELLQTALPIVIKLALGSAVAL